MNILILDYSVDRHSAATIMRWLPEQAEVAACCVDADFPPPDGTDLRGFTHIIHSGSALSIVATSPFMDAVAEVINDACARGIPQMGICYGHQLLCRTLVGAHAVRANPNGLEAGWCEVEFSALGRELLGVAGKERVWHHHFDEVTSVPTGSQVIATNSHTGVQAFVDRGRSLFGVQFHPEFDRTEGNRVFAGLADKLAAHGYRADAIINGGPSLDAAAVFFGFFLRSFGPRTKDHRGDNSSTPDCASITA